MEAATGEVRFGLNAAQTPTVSVDGDEHIYVGLLSPDKSLHRCVDQRGRWRLLDAHKAFGAEPLRRDELSLL